MTYNVISILQKIFSRAGFKIVWAIGPLLANTLFLAARKAVLDCLNHRVGFDDFEAVELVVINHF